MPTHELGPISSYAGSIRWTYAVARMTPDPKCRASRYASSGILSDFMRRATRGNIVKHVETKRITNTEDTRTPRDPLYSLPPKYTPFITHTFQASVTSSLSTVMFAGLYCIGADEEKSVLLYHFSRPWWCVKIRTKKSSTLAIARKLPQVIAYLIDVDVVDGPSCVCTPRACVAAEPALAPYGTGCWRSLSPKRCARPASQKTPAGRLQSVHVAVPGLRTGHA
ncbi:hypothetical protein KL951_001066 [Ogataea haglerorum]|nr:hypothetical protein KL951_001066 [Ogataea haglerorum]